MNFNEMILACESVDNEFDSTFRKCVAFAEASYNEYKTNLKEAGLKVAKESGTPDDLIYLEEAASEGFIVRSAKTIEKIIQTFIKWIKDKIDAVKKFFSEKKTKDALDNAEKVINNNPKLKHKMITVPDYEKQEKGYKKLADEVKKMKASAKAGKIKESDSDNLDKVDEDLDKLNKQKKAITVTISLATAIAMVTIYYNMFIKQNPDSECSISPTDLENMTPEDAEIIVHLVRTETEIEKAESSALFDAMTDTFQAVKGAITGEGTIEPDIISKESTDNTEVLEEKEIDSSIQEAYISNILDDMDKLIQERGEGAPDDPERENPFIPITKPETEKKEFTIPEVVDMDVEESCEDSLQHEVECYLESIVEEIWGKKDIRTESSFNAQAMFESMEAELFGSDNKEFDVNAYLESMEADLLKDEEVTSVSPEAYIENMAAELFGYEEEETVTAEQYLESMEAELFSETEEEITESADDKLEAMLDDIINSLN